MNASVSDLNVIIVLTKETVFVCFQCRRRRESVL